MVGLNRFSLKVIGCWPEEADNERLKDAYVLWIIFLVVFGHLVPQMYAFSLIINELPLMIDNGFMIMALSTAMVKLTILWRNKKKLMFIIASIQSDCFKWKEDWERELMLSTATQSRFLTIGGYVMVVANAIVVMFGPLVGWNFRLINNITDIGNRNLPTQTYYPYDYSITPYFEMTYALQILSITLTAISLMSPVVLFVSVVSYSCGQISILGIKVSNLSIASRTEELQKNRGFKWQLKGIVDAHTRIIRIVHKIESIFKNLALTQAVAGSAMACCLGFQILNTIDSTTESPPVQQLMFLALIFLTQTLLMFVYCFAGESLVYHCEQMHTRIYETDWYCWSSKNAMDLMQLLVGTKERLNLSAGRFFYLNFQSFSRILKSIAGYISVLIAVQNK